MSHLLPIILGKTKTLREAADSAGDGKAVIKLDDLAAGAEALDAKITHGDPHSTEIETVLEELQAWLESVTFAAPNFVAELDQQIAAMQPYLP